MVAGKNDAGNMVSLSRCRTALADSVCIPAILQTNQINLVRVAFVQHAVIKYQIQLFCIIVERFSEVSHSVCSRGQLLELISEMCRGVILLSYNLIVDIFFIFRVKINTILRKIVFGIKRTESKARFINFL